MKRLLICLKVILLVVGVVACSNNGDLEISEKRMNLLIEQAGSSFQKNSNIINEIETYLLSIKGPMNISVDTYLGSKELFGEDENFAEQYKFEKKLSETFFSVAKKPKGETSIYFSFIERLLDDGDLWGEYVIFICRVDSNICRNVYQENLKDRRVKSRKIVLNEEWVMVAYYYKV